MIGRVLLLQEEQLRVSSHASGCCRNKLDLVIVTLALVDIFTASDKVSSLSSVFRIFRVVRLAKVLQQVK